MYQRAFCPGRDVRSAVLLCMGVVVLLWSGEIPHGLSARISGWMQIDMLHGPPGLGSREEERNGFLCCMICDGECYVCK